MGNYHVYCHDTGFARSDRRHWGGWVRVICFELHTAHIRQGLLAVHHLLRDQLGRGKLRLGRVDRIVQSGVRLDPSVLDLHLDGRNPDPATRQVPVPLARVRKGWLDHPFHT